MRLPQVRATGLGLVALVLAGCSTAPAYKAQVPDVTTNCVGNLADVVPVPLKYAVADGTPAHYAEFARISRCYRAGDAVGRPVAIYRLEGVVAPAEVNVAVQLSTGGTFAAALEILDSDFRSLRRYEFKDFVRRGTQYSLIAFLNPDEGVPAYVMLAPDDTQVGKSDTVVGSTSTPVIIPAGPVMFAYHAGSETATVRPFLAGGRVMVTVRPQSTAPIGTQ